MKCEYQGECQILCNDEENCFVKSLFKQIYDLEKELKIAKIKIEQLVEDIDDLYKEMAGESL